MKGRLALVMGMLLLSVAGAFAEGGQVSVSTGPAAPAAATVLTPREAWKKIDQGAVLVDVRSAAETAGGMLPGALNVPHTRIQEYLYEFGADKNRTIVLYCRSGRRSALAKSELESLGYTNVFNGGSYAELLAEMKQR